MRVRLCSRILCLVMATVLPAAVAQLQRGTPEEAKAMAQRAAALVRSIGEPALTEFNEPGGKWRDRDLYVFVYDQHGTVLAGDPSILGQNRKDVPSVQQMLNIADEGSDSF